LNSSRGKQEIQYGTMQILNNGNSRNLNSDANIYTPKTATAEVNLKAITISPVN